MPSPVEGDAFTVTVEEGKQPTYQSDPTDPGQKPSDTQKPSGGQDGDQTDKAEQTEQTTQTEPVALTVSAAASLTDVMEELAVQYETEHPEVDISFTFGGSGALQAQIEDFTRQYIETILYPICYRYGLNGVMFEKNIPESKTLESFYDYVAKFNAKLEIEKNEIKSLK